MVRKDVINEFFINGVSSKYYLADLIDNSSESLEVGETDVSSEYVYSQTTGAFTSAEVRAGLKQVKVPVAFAADSYERAEKQKSLLENVLCSGVCELYFPEHNMYFKSCLTNIGKSTHLMEGVVTCQYSFMSIQHSSLVKTVVSNGTLYNEGTGKSTSCKIDAIITTTASSYKVAGITFDSVNQGDEIVIDGINQVVTKNGVSCLLGTDLISFPTLSPGLNIFDTRQSFNIEYYPAYV
jgi:hypothetical protein